MMLRILNYLFTGLFLLSAAVQYNDPDPVQWMAVYLAAAALCVLHIIGRFPRRAAGALVVVSVLWGAFLIYQAAVDPGELTIEAVFGSAAMKNERVELAREAGGLAITAAWTLVLLFFPGEARAKR